MGRREGNERWGGGREMRGGEEEGREWEVGRREWNERWGGGSGMRGGEKGEEEEGGE